MPTNLIGIRCLRYAEHPVPALAPADGRRIMGLVVFHLQSWRLTCDNGCFFTVGAGYLTTYFSYWTIGRAVLTAAPQIARP